MSEEQNIPSSANASAGEHEEAGNEKQKAERNEPPHTSDSQHAEPSQEVLGTIVTPPAGSSGQLLTPDMEVHHHTHSPRKKWTHYLFEFFMLFLAVFCGFLAEWQLEHAIEHKKEKQFIRSMVEDLKEDSLKLRHTLRSEEQTIQGLDTLLAEVLNYSEKGGDAKRIYRLVAMWGEYFPNLQLTDRTTGQLKYSGSMRLISKQRVSDSILAYEEASRAVRLMQEETLMYFVKRAFDQLMSVINSSYYVKAGSFENLMAMKEPLELLTSNKSELMITYNNLSLLRRLIIKRKQDLQQHLSRAQRLITVLKKEYNLK